MGSLTVGIFYWNSAFAEKRADDNRWRDQLSRSRVINIAPTVKPLAGSRSDNVNIRSRSRLTGEFLEGRLNRQPVFYPEVDFLTRWVPPAKVIYDRWPSRADAKGIPPVVVNLTVVKTFAAPASMGSNNGITGFNIFGDNALFSLNPGTQSQTALGY